MSLQRRQRTHSVFDRCRRFGGAALASGAVLLSSPTLACDRNSLAESIDAPLAAKADKTFDVSEIQSTDGGAWEIFFAPDGRTAGTILRTDYGESGKSQLRLTILSSSAYAVARKRSFYSVPYAVEGSTTIRETRDIYLFCDGRLVTPDKATWDGGGVYEQAATEALAIFDASEIKPYLAKLERRQLRRPSVDR